MSGLRNPDSRRALRAAIEAGTGVGLLALVWWIVDLLRFDPGGLLEIASSALAIIGLGTLFYGMENVTRAFKFDIGPGGIDVQSGAADGSKDGANG